MFEQPRDLTAVAASKAVASIYDALRDRKWRPIVVIARMAGVHPWHALQVLTAMREAGEVESNWDGRNGGRIVAEYRRISPAATHDKPQKLGGPKRRRPSPSERSPSEPVDPKVTDFLDQLGNGGDA